MSATTDEATGVSSRRRRLDVPAGGPDVLPRPRLTALLGAADVTTVVAPAGFGKTTLLAAWARALDGPVAWLTLTAADADPYRLAADLAAALRSAAGAGSPLAVLEPPALDTDLVAVVAGLHDALADGPGPLVLVLDDVHHLPSGQPALRLLDALLQDAPEQLRVVLAARQQPALRLQRLRLGDRLGVVDEAALAFTPAETAEAAREIEPRLDDDAVAELHRSTSGWPVAVRLAVLAGRAGDGRWRPGPSGELTEYLVSEVLDSLVPEQRQFVLDASVDDLVCAPLLDTVRAGAGSGELLSRCYEQGLFLSRLDETPGEPVWYRWHQVFVTHVRRAAQRADGSRQQVLEGRAAEWWRHRDVVAAVGHAVRAERPELGAELAADAWPDLVLAGRTDTVAELIRQLPEGLEREAELHLALAFVEANRGEQVGARHELERAQAVADRLGAADRARFDARTAALSLRYLVTDQQSLQESVERGRELLRRLEDGPWIPDPVTLTLTRLCVGMGEARLQQDNLRALTLLRSAEAMARDRGMTALELVAQAETCIPSIATGELEDAAEVADHVVRATVARGWGTPGSIAPALAYQGWLSYWRGELSATRTTLSTVLDHLHASDTTYRGLVSYFRALAHLHDGDLEAVEDDVHVLRELGTSGAVPPTWPSIVRSLEAELLLARGELDAARSRARSRAPGRQYRLATTARARVLLRAGEPQEALDVLAELDEREVFRHVAVQRHRLRADVAYARGDLADAHQELERALDHAAPLGLVLPFLVDGDALAPLLRAHTAVTSHEALALALLERTERTAPAELPWPTRLTPRELTVLRYLPTTLTITEIAEAEFISPNTVKTHIANVYRKLGVQGRREAARAALSLGLL